LLDRTAKMNEAYKNTDKDERGVWKSTPLHAKSGSSTYEIAFSNGVVWSPPKGRYPLYSKKDLYKLFDENRLYFGKDGKGSPNQKSFLTEVKQGKTVGSIWSYSDVGSSHQSNEEVAKLIGKGIFDNPKTTKLLIAALKTSNGKDSIILDFFAGSGTTGDAVMQLNAEDGGKRKYILVQLPEIIDSKKNKTAFDFVKDDLGVEKPTIFEITKERLIRASKKTKEETIATKIAEKEKAITNLNGKLDFDNKEEIVKRLKAEIENLKNQDLGFKIFETMPIWDDYNYEADELNPQTKLFDESKLTEEDLKALLITWKTYDGLLLTEDLKETDLDGYVGYYANDKMYLMHKGFTSDNLKALLEKIDTDKKFNPTSIIAFGYHFESKNLREIAENIKSYTNKKNIDIEFITRY